MILPQARTKVLLVELNEVTWDLIDPLIAQGRLPTFARLKREGARAAPVSVDLPPQLDPWITWTTVYTGRRQSDHNVYFLEQPPETIRAKRIWELCLEQGLRVGVYGSLCSWPPRAIDGFYVPDTFAQDASTYPESLRPIQELNLTYTRSIRLPADHDGWRFKARLGAQIGALGLRPGTMARIARQLAEEQLSAGRRWKRVALQPIVNADFFATLYRRHRPDFATFHTNHVAHYMHTYWKAMEPDRFAQPTSDGERRQYGGAIEHGYRAADELLQRMLGLMDTQTTLVVASSMGQRPYTSDLREGKPISQVRSLDRLLEILGVQDRVRALSTMSDQFNLYADSEETRAALESRLRAVHVDRPECPLFHLTTLGESMTVNLNFYDEVGEASRIRFPHETDGRTHRYGDLVYNSVLIKSGCHDLRGMMILYGARIRAGAQVAACDNLDIAPTLLALMGIEAPPEMKGRVLAEVFTGSGAAGGNSTLEMGSRRLVPGPLDVLDVGPRVDVGL